jgi:hypothetical protein
MRPSSSGVLDGGGSTAVIRHGADDLGFKERAEFFGSVPPSRS